MNGSVVLRNVARLGFALWGVGLLCVAGGRATADEGMWLLNAPPSEVLKQKYQFEPSPQWLEHVQKSAVRMYASGSLVSKDGLLLTNHHVGSDQLVRLSTPERDLLRTGFYARTREEELRCRGLEIQLLWSIEDVTEQVAAAATAEMSPAAALDARQKAMTRIEQQSREQTGLDSEVVTLFHGGAYHLYRYKRYDDLRLVMAPEMQIAFFGGDVDNFEFPRFNLDMCFFRVYENDKPLNPEHYLKVAAKPLQDGDLTFVVGHPYRTRRLFTVDHCKFLRDVDLPNTLAFLRRREVLLQSFAERSPESAQLAKDDVFAAQNARKAYTGIYAALTDPHIMQSKESGEETLRGKVALLPGDAPAKQAWDRIAAAQREHAAFFRRHYALNDRRAFNSDLLRIAMTIVRLSQELPKPSQDRLREYRDSELDSVYLELYADSPIRNSLEVQRMHSDLTLLSEWLGGDDPLVVTAMGGQPPLQRAQELVAGCKLADVELRKQLVAGGKAAVDSSADPMIRLALALEPDKRELHKKYEEQVESIERAAYGDLARMRFQAAPNSTYPDATTTLRLSFGAVAGYDEGDRKIAPFTTFAGLYERFEQRGPAAPFDLPQRWIDAKSKLDPATPFNFVCTADIIGGNSGSPVVDRDGALVGLIFDGNIQSLAWDVAYTDVQARAVSVDVRAILEALRKVYDAGPLADELEGK